ncbi:MAG: PilZ domain-containing protein [bacterium]|nr:PilZ domain-containing protein [bacterium]
MKERRRAERVDASLKLELRLPGMPNAFLGESINISCNGIYFQTEYFMEEGTRLPMHIILGGEKNIEVATICPDGVVVRCTPEEDDPACKEYHVACFFMEISDDDQATLDTYIASKQPSGGK